MNGKKPLIITFYDLCNILSPLHLWNKSYIDRLHDVWKLGAPTPNTIIMNPKHYDERRKQVGNYEARIVLPTALAKWMVEVANWRSLSPEAMQRIQATTLKKLAKEYTR